MGSFSQSCCFCLSLRFGVIVIATIAMIGGAIGFIGSIIGVRNAKDETTYDKVLLWLHVFIYFLLSIFGAVGLVGGIRQRYKLVSAFYPMLLTHFTFTLSMGIITLRRMFADGGSYLINKCLKEATDGTSKDNCRDRLARQKKTYIPVLIFCTIIDLYCLYVVYNYKKQLKSRDAQEKDEFINSA
ncbi:hypothetical protein HGRIS_002300 [Hohenbuehelia grisea]|uniref:Tetraspanin n=1 Tax=Hohenbuehelia grisea TaxID=104357 RepID=A0ABR3JK29_9AGAR